MFLFFLVNNNETPSDAKYDFRGQPQHINTCTLTPRLPRIFRHFLTADSHEEAQRLGLGKGPGISRLFSTLKEKAKS